MRDFDPYEVPGSVLFVVLLVFVLLADWLGWLPGGGA